MSVDLSTDLELDVAEQAAARAFATALSEQSRHGRGSDRNRERRLAW
jgi:hypothetical protein